MLNKKYNRYHHFKLRSNFNQDVSEEEKTTLKLSLTRSWWISLKKVLWLNKVSAQGFFEFIAVLIGMNDDRILSILEDYKKLRDQNKIKDNVLENADEETLFRIIQEELEKEKNNS